MTIEERAHRYEHDDPHCEMPWCGCCPVLIDEFRAVAEERDAEMTALADALEQVKAALGDRLLGRGPLSEGYAHAVTRQINDALRAAGRLP